MPIPKVVEAVVEQMKKLDHTSTLYAKASTSNLAEKLASIAPGNLKKTFFTSSGTEANETAIAAARTIPAGSGSGGVAAFLFRPQRRDAGHVRAEQLEESSEHHCPAFIMRMHPTVIDVRSISNIRNVA